MSTVNPCLWDSLINYFFIKNSYITFNGNIKKLLKNL